MEYKRKKNYIPNKESNLKKFKLLNIETGMTGFLCTCNFREKDCVRDAYKLLNEFADEIDELNEDKKPTICKEENTVKNEIEPPENDEQNNSDEEDISTSLSKEINQLKAESDKPIALRRFQVVNTGVKNVVFIKTTLSNPLELVSKIIKELDRTKKQRSRFLLRLLPVEVICKAYMKDIKAEANVIFKKYFSQEPKTFSIVLNRHSNDSIKREIIINDLAEIIKKTNPGNRANLKNPELAVVVEVIRGLCLISIAPDYYKYRKYNLLEICAHKQNDTHVKDSDTKNSDTTVKKETEISNKSTTNTEDTIMQDNEDDNPIKSETSNITEEVKDEK
ncbi:hypothetical protein M0802_012977 [Mischocyttarus mexicanus]|nr:hypothetical protein M0802_014238 [Mischocyttarus mexicanus]KAI4484907.1 hypothetical protein M0802_012977 [Mischocyttarus mexicanus]